MDNTYNGWRNHATWCVGLHLMDTVTEWIIDDRDEWTMDDVDNAAEIFKDLVSEMLEESEIATFPLLWELLDLSDIDYEELGRSALESALD